MDRVTTIEDIIEEIKIRKPEFDPQLIDSISRFIVKDINNLANDPNIIEISLGCLGNLSANLYLSFYNPDRTRHNILNDINDKRYVGFLPPYLSGALKRVLKLKMGNRSLRREKYEKYMSRIADKTNEHYYKYNKD